MKGKFITKIATSKPVTKVAKVLVSNAPKILTGISIVSSIAAAAFAVKGTILAVEIEEQRKQKITNGDIPEPEHPKAAVVKSVWKCYIPTAACLAVSIGTSLYGVNVATARAAVATAAYKATELAFDEYKAKVAEEIGEEKEKKIRQDIEKEHVKEYEDRQAPLVAPFEKYLCREKYSGAMFYSNLFEIKDTFNLINYDMLRGSDDISLMSYLDYFGIESKNEEIGWNISITGMLELTYNSSYDAYGRPIIEFGTTDPPYDNYNIYG